MSRRQKLYRQGDVLLIPTTAKASGEVVPRDAGRIVLAYGEVTGHAHAIIADEAELTRDPATEARFLQVLAEGGVDLTHEEHGTVTLPKGTYQVVGQREYSAYGERAVAD